MHGIPLKRAGIVIDAGNRRDEASSNVTRYPIRDVVEDMLVLFYNDFMVAKHMSSKHKSLAIAYEAIADQFERLALFFGVMPSPWMLESPLRSMFQRIEPEGEPVLDPSRALYAISSYLQGRLDEAEATDFADDTVLQRGGGIEFRLPGIASILAGFPETAGLQALIAGETWRATAPVYLPVMKTSTLMSAAE